jgi:uncharacterized protein YceH (UPF0502 family)/uncharacterized cupin superfamily protein
VPDADAVEIRVLGCLIEKQRTTPDVYPLSLNALRLACNQATNRDPVVDYDDATVRAALERLSEKRWARLASGPGSRAAKYRHLLSETLSVEEGELALLGALMLRGPQTPGELRQRSERLYRFGSAAEFQDALDSLIARGLAAQLPRRPGQKEQRYAQQLGAGGQPERPAKPATEVVGRPEGLRRTNVLEIETGHDVGDPAGYETGYVRLGPIVGGKLLGATVYELPPGQSICPYHYEYGNEEWLLVLEGRPTLRHPGGEDELPPGELVCFPEGPEGAHKVTNATDRAARVLIVSTKVDPSLAVYPDSDKIGAWSGDERDRILVRRESGVDYWDREL